MSAPLWSQVDVGVALTLGAILDTAAIRKLQHPRVLALTLERLDPALTARRKLTIRLALAIAGFELMAGTGVVAFRGSVGFAFACAMTVACVGFLLALARVVRRSVPCACFGRLGRTAAGGREIGRGIALVAGSVFLVGHRALDASPAYGFGPAAVVAVVGFALLIVLAQRIGGHVRPGVDLRADAPRDRESLGQAARALIGIDSDLYSVQTNGK